MDAGYGSWKAARPRAHLAILYLFMFTGLINLICYILYLYPSRKVYGVYGTNAYIIFACIGLAVFVLVSSPLIYWPYAHGSEMSPVSRQHALFLGIAISLLAHDFPMVWVELWVVTTFGWTEILQAISLFLTLLCFIISFLVTWIAYSWKLSKVLQIRYGDAASGSSAVPAAQFARRSSSRAYCI
ncbi:hypothetical protein CUR178_06146 [Leishmania enriettii]|uniref:Uncharacterized protein n=1 Tax=Leishmania enriettii TaxID=5663 RepID=A0A836KLM1_LEIEN|nr:hypothetical protein CUR178_06146 [Leishmania enriettii]